MVDPYGEAPLRDQVADILTARIESGEWRKRDWLPSETTLTQELGVSRDTLRRALKLMQEAGLIDSRRGRGWFVR
jgi:DNA-binding GntR family transcriptional regulator